MPKIERQKNTITTVIVYDTLGNWLEYGSIVNRLEIAFRIELLEPSYVASVAVKHRRIVKARPNATASPSAFNGINF